MRTAPTMIGVDIHFGPDSIAHKYHPGDDRCHAYGVLKIDSGSATYANLYFDTDPAHIDKMIAELVALRAEMTADDEYRLTPKGAAALDFAPGAEPVTDGEPWTRAGVAAAIAPAPSVPNPPHHILPSEQPCTAPGYDDRGVNGSGYMCTAQDGHDGPDHIAYMPGGGEYHRWPVAEPAPSGMQDPAPVARVITDSERTCPEQHPGSGAPCYRDGDHGVHRDPDGEEWRTDGAERGLASCGHPANDDGECDCSSWPERAVMAR